MKKRILHLYFGDQEIDHNLCFINSSSDEPYLMIDSASIVGNVHGRLSLNASIGDLKILLEKNEKRIINTLDKQALEDEAKKLEQKPNKDNLLDIYNIN